MSYVGLAHCRHDNASANLRVRKPFDPLSEWQDA